MKCVEILGNKSHQIINPQKKTQRIWNTEYASIRILCIPARSFSGLSKEPHVRVYPESVTPVSQNSTGMGHNPLLPQHAATGNNHGTIMEPYMIIGKIMKSWKNIGKTQDPSREVGGIWISRHSVLFGSLRYYLFLLCLRHPLNDAKTGWPTGCAARLQGPFFFAFDVWMLGASLCQPQGHLSRVEHPHVPPRSGSARQHKSSETVFNM